MDITTCRREIGANNFPKEYDMTEMITTPIAEMTSRMDSLQIFFIMLLIVILAAIGIFGYVVIKMTIATRERAETRNKQIEKAVQTAMVAINAVEELKVIVETQNKHYHEEIKDLKLVDIRIFDKIEEIKDKVVEYLVGRGKNDKG